MDNFQKNLRKIGFGLLLLASAACLADEPLAVPNDQNQVVGNGSIVPQGVPQNGDSVNREPSSIDNPVEISSDSSSDSNTDYTNSGAD